MRLPVRLINDDSDLRFQIYTVVGIDDKVICNVPFDRAMNSSMVRAKMIGERIVESLNRDLNKFEVKVSEGNNFCLEAGGNGSNSMVVKRRGNPNWVKGMKRPDGAGRKKKGLLGKVMAGLTG